MKSNAKKNNRVYWGVAIGVWGADTPDLIKFTTQEARDEFYDTHDHVDKISPSEMAKMETSAIPTLQEWRYLRDED